MLVSDLPKTKYGCVVKPVSSLQVEELVLFATRREVELVSTAKLKEVYTRMTCAVCKVCLQRL